MAPNGAVFEKGAEGENLETMMKWVVQKRTRPATHTGGHTRIKTGAVW